MKRKLRYFISIFTIIVVLCLSSCDHLENTEYHEFKIADDLEIHQEEKSYPRDFSKITFSIENHSDTVFSYSKANVLEFNKNGIWKTVPSKNEGYIAVAYNFNSQCTIDMSIHSGDYDFKFQEGDYRFIIPVISDNGTEKQVVFYFSLDEE